MEGSFSTNLDQALIQHHMTQADINNIPRVSLFEVIPIEYKFLLRHKNKVFN
jgi:hypothetical protein